MSAVSGRPGKASGAHRKDARGMSIIGLGMAVLPSGAEKDVEAGSAALRVDWPVYPRRAEHNIVAEGGNRRWAETECRPVGRRTEKTSFAKYNKNASEARGLWRDRRPKTRKFSAVPVLTRRV